MAKRKSTTAASDYDSDGGFVADAPRGKKAKSGGAKGGSEKREKVEEEERSVGGGGRVGRDGEEFWEVSGFFFGVWVRVGYGEGKKRLRGVWMVY